MAFEARLEDPLGQYGGDIYVIDLFLLMGASQAGRPIFKYRAPRFDIVARVRCVRE
jgi:hypothetical protein